MAHMYRAVINANHHQSVIENVMLPEVTRQVRKELKLIHGNKIRTALLEEGIYYAEGFGRKKSNQHVFYHVEITCERS